jgi:phenylpropionate dioxygenase-like ring-hydroxylating dioxygenase large terminal subunit
VVGDSIRCPYHGWEYGPDGRCTKVPGTKCAPEGARQRTFAAEARHGLVFLFNGPEPLFPLPFFLGEDPARLVAGRPFSFAADCSWPMLASHAFDTQHFLSVHDRELIGAPEIDEPAPFARRNRYTARVTGTGPFDRLLRVFAGRTVAISITTFGGSLFFLTGSFRRAASCFMIAARPVGPDRCHVDGVCFARTRGTLLDALTVPVVLAVRRVFTRGYLAHESEILQHTRYQPWALTEVDADLVGYFRWQAALPKDAPARPLAGAAARPGATRSLKAGDREARSAPPAP